ncbi:hypothetical protein M3Y95_00192000 [Aphelenchoides besseyi]|nr:hypothetical protein M3Y95_00192000 [Aphelenchoides besseyi]
MLPSRMNSVQVQLPPIGESNTSMSGAELMAKAASNGGLDERRGPPEMLRLNVGGRSAILAMDVIRLRLDSSRLADFCDKTHTEKISECDLFLEATNEYYFERSPTIFDLIVDYYVTGKLHLPTDACAIKIRDELNYWRIPLSNISPCCRFEDGSPQPNGTLPRFASNDPVDESNSEAFEKVVFGKQRFSAWQFLENPRSSNGAKIFSAVSASFVLFSLTGLILSSCPDFQIDEETMTPHWTIAAIEIVCMLFFTLEYVARFVVSPQKWEFAKSPLNCIDLATILPFFAEECMPLFGIRNIELRNLRGPMIVMRVLRVMRVVRIFKLARYSTGLRAFGDTMRKSASEFSLLAMFLLSGIMLFSTAVYFFERDEPNTKFYSIPQSWWWCISTMTTVGYGDLVPVTIGGKIVAASASVCGIIVLAFPISMILDKFAESTTGFKKDEYVTLQRPAVLIDNQQMMANNRFKNKIRLNSPPIQTPIEQEHFNLNVGGKRFSFRSDVVLTCRQDSLLSTLIKADHSKRLLILDGFDERAKEYYLERNATVATNVLEYFVTGKLHKPFNCCPERFTEELKYWKLYNVEFAGCCAPSMNISFNKKDLAEEEHEFDGVCCSPARLIVWRIMEDPTYSLWSKLFSIVSIAFIFASIIGLILGSMPEFQEDNRYAQGYSVFHQRQRHRTDKLDDSIGARNLAAHNLTGYVYKPTDNPNQKLVVLEYICISWFTFEFLLRFLVAPRKQKFMKQPMNIIDLLTVLPVYIELVLFQLGIYAETLKEFTAAMIVIRVLRTLRMARVFKMARYSSGLQIFGQTLRTSIFELSLLLVLIVTGTLFFATLMFYTERENEHSDFTSIPAACWWAVITITTVGYGEMVVQTALGKLVATTAAICGIIILAFPVSLIVENFAQAQHLAKIEVQMRQAQMSAVANNLVMKRGQSRRRRAENEGKQTKSQTTLLHSTTAAV